MPKPNDELLERVLEGKPPSLSPEQQFRKATARWFEGRKNLYTVGSTLVVLVGLALLVYGGRNLRVGLLADRGGLITSSFLTVMLGIGTLLFNKLWFRVAGNNAATLRQLLLLRSAISQLRSEQSGESPKAGESVELVPLLPEEFRGRLNSLWGGVSNRTVEWVSVIVVVACTLVAGLKLMVLFDGSGITQVDQWRFAPGDRVVARSRISFERPPTSGHFITVTLPYPGAEITSVTADDRPLRSVKLDWRRYEVEMPIEPAPARTIEILVTWEFPVDRLASVGGGYRTTLSALLPVSFYRLELVVDEESGYEAVGQLENQPLGRFFSNRWSEETHFGACSLGVRKKVEQ
ncbi:hypothetical protein ACFL5Q_04885 [Planctomycetota bacterium]